MACLVWMCLVAALFPTFIRIRPQHHITPESYDQLQAGMSLEEVEKILGGPAGDYGPGKGQIVEYGTFTMASHYPNGKRWLADDLEIIVCFDENGRVRGKGTENVYRPYI